MCRAKEIPWNHFDKWEPRFVDRDSILWKTFHFISNLPLQYKQCFNFHGDVYSRVRDAHKIWFSLNSDHSKKLKFSIFEKSILLYLVCMRFGGKWFCNRLVWIWVNFWMCLFIYIHVWHLVMYLIWQKLHSAKTTK